MCEFKLSLCLFFPPTVCDNSVIVRHSEALIDVLCSQFVHETALFPLLSPWSPFTPWLVAETICLISFACVPHLFISASRLSPLLSLIVCQYLELGAFAFVRLSHSLCSALLTTLSLPLITSESSTCTPKFRATNHLPISFYLPAPLTNLQCKAAAAAQTSKHLPYPFFTSPILLCPTLASSPQGLVGELVLADVQRDRLLGEVSRRFYEPFAMP